jgi:putative inorganic carbon (hco3(-)) transporter
MHSPAARRPSGSRVASRLVACAVSAAVVAAVLTLLRRGLVAYAAAVPVAIVAALLLARHPQFGYYAMVFLVPFETFRGAATKGIGLALAVILLLGAAVRRRPVFDLRSTLVRGVGAFLGVAIVSSLMSPFFPDSLYNIRQTATACLFFLLTLALVSGHGYRVVIPRLIVWSTLLSSVLAVTDYVVGLPLLKMTIQEDVLKRIVGGTLNPNHFASMLLFGLPFAVNDVFAGGGARRWIAVGTLGAGLVAVILTYSRGAALVAAAMFILLGWHFRTRLTWRRFSVILPIVVLGLAAAAAAIPSSYWRRLSSVTAGESDESISRRMSYLLAGGEAALRHPVVGSGPGTFYQIYGQSRYAARYASKEEDLYRDAHNTYFEVLVGMGALGIGAMLVLVATALRRYLRAWREARDAADGPLADVNYAYLVSFLSVVLYFCMLSRPYSKHFWMGLALAEVALRVTRDAREGTP